LEFGRNAIDKLQRINSFKGKKNEVKSVLHRNLAPKKNFQQYIFPSIHSYESNAATIQIHKGTEILYFSFKFPMNHRRPNHFSVQNRRTSSHKPQSMNTCALSKKKRKEKMLAMSCHVSGRMFRVFSDRVACS
jgi:hypothetical protein